MRHPRPSESGDHLSASHGRGRAFWSKSISPSTAMFLTACWTPTSPTPSPTTSVDSSGRGTNGARAPQLAEWTNKQVASALTVSACDHPASLVRVIVFAWRLLLRGHRVVINQGWAETLRL